MRKLCARPIRRLARRAFLTVVRAVIGSAWHHLIVADGARPSALSTAAARAEGDPIWVELWGMGLSLYQLHAIHRMFSGPPAGFTRAELLDERRKRQMAHSDLEFVDA